MQNKSQFGVFMDDGHGPIWRDSFADMGEAKAYAQALAETAGTEIFVYSFIPYTEVARFSPAKSNPHVKPTQASTREGDQ